MKKENDFISENCEKKREYEYKCETKKNTKTTQKGEIMAKKVKGCMVGIICKKNIYALKKNIYIAIYF